MKTRGTTSKMICPECGAEYILARKETHTTFWGRLSGPRRYESSLPSPPPWTYQHASAPPVVQPSTGALAPGEHEWRTMNLHADVTTPLRYALVWAGETIALGGSIALAVEVSPWFWLGTAGTVAGSIVYYLVTRPILATDDRWFRTRERDAEPADDDAQAAPVPYHVSGELAGPKPGQRLYLKFELSDLDAARAWHNFCIAVADGKNFSYREAKRHKVGDPDWSRIYAAFVAQHWCTAAGERGTPELSTTGKAWVRQFARTPPPE